jgi:hypothetical protein
MMNKGVDVRSILTGLTTAFVISALAGVLAGCAAGPNNGTLQRDRDLDNQFLAYEVVPDHKYYFSGGYAKPNAILGIHKDYQLVSDLWQPVEISSGQLERWIRTIAPENYRGTAGYFGNKIEVNTPNLHQPEAEGGRRRGRF